MESPDKYGPPSLASYKMLLSTSIALTWTRCDLIRRSIHLLHTERAAEGATTIIYRRTTRVYLSLGIERKHLRGEDEEREGATIRYGARKGDTSQVANAK